jgi:hypothetical protein
MKKRLLIISDIAPTPDFTAGIILERFIQGVQNNFLLKFFIIHDRSLGNYHVSRYLKANQLFWTSKPREDWSGLRRLPKIFRRHGEKISEKDTANIASDVKVQISREAPDHLVIVIQGQTTIKLAESLHNLGIPITYIHWDLWDWWRVAHGLSEELDNLTKERINSVFTEGFHLVPTANYADHYEISPDRYIALYPSLIERISRKISNSNSQIDIAFAGQGYASHEITKFINALDSIDWYLDGRRIILNIFGKIHLESSNASSMIINRGWFHYEKLPEELSKCDLAFLPYPSEGILEKVAFTSFPSKLCSYSSANLPVLYVGPLKTPTSVIASSIGVSLDSSVSESSIIEAIRQLMNKRTDYISSNELVFTEYFSGISFRNSLNKWMMANGLGSLGDAETSRIDSHVPQFIENFESFQVIDKKLSNDYFLVLFALTNPRILFRKLRTKLFRALRKIIK